MLLPGSRPKNLKIWTRHRHQKKKVEITSRRPPLPGLRTLCEELAGAFNLETAFLRESAVQAKIHDPKEPGMYIASLAAARTLEGLSCALRAFGERRERSDRSDPGNTTALAAPTENEDGN